MLVRWTLLRLHVRLVTARVRVAEVAAINNTKTTREAAVGLNLELTLRRAPAAVKAKDGIADGKRIVCLE